MQRCGGNALAMRWNPPLQCGGNAPAMRGTHPGTAGALALLPNSVNHLGNERKVRFLSLKRRQEIEV